MQAPRGATKRPVGPRSVEARRRAQEKKMPFYRDVFGVKGSQIEKPSADAAPSALALPVLCAKTVPHSPSVSILVPHAAPISTPKSSLLLGPQTTGSSRTPMVPWTPDPQQ